MHIILDRSVRRHTMMTQVVCCCGGTEALEHCQGYVDKNGMWNNGFYCPRWGGPDDVYCCGDGGERFCCPQPVSPAQGPSTPRDDDSAAGSDNALA